MTELVPCPACKRHVGACEVACPFCTRALPPARPQHAVVLGRVSRAAIFSAALAACSDDKPKQPAPAPPAQGGDDLEKLLDPQPRAVDSPPLDAARADAALVDAGVPDAGVPPDAGVVKKKRKRVQQEPVDPIKLPDHIHNAKPYGAPPWRRRIV